MTQLNKSTVSTVEKFLVDLNDYEILESIQKSNYCTTQIVKCRSTEKKYVAKTYFFAINLRNRLPILQKISCLLYFQHPTLFNIKGFSYKDFENKENITSLMKFNGRRSLAYFKYNSFTNTVYQKILIGVARAMMLLHQKHIIHGNLNPDNILLDNKYYPKITDFCLSKRFDINDLENCSIQYISPEVIISNRLDEKSDVYSFGILMYEIVSKSRAFNNFFKQKNFNKLKFIKKVSKEGLRPSFNFPIKKGLKRMIEACWSNNPEERPTFSELFNKLSMSEEGNIMYYEENHYKPVIKLSGEDYSSKSYCLDDVDEEDIFSYLCYILDGISMVNEDSCELNQLKEKLNNRRRRRGRRRRRFQN